MVLLLQTLCNVANAQADNEDDTAETPPLVRKDVAYNTFSATRIVDGSTVKNLDGGVLDFRIAHRFGRVSEGSQNFFGLDDATTRIGLDYGITRWLMVGIGHSVLNKENDGFTKIKLLGQRRDGMPLSLSYVGEMSVQTTLAPILPAGDKWLYRYRLYYANQLLIARRFSDRISLQIMPSIVHYNIVDDARFSNNTVAIGVGGKIKITKRVAITGEYYYRVTNQDMLYNGATTYNTLSAGFEVESGGHVFQLLVTNAQGITERSFIGQTTDSWSKGQLHFGFNISRIFVLVKPREL